MDARVELLKALAHPLRLRVVDRLGHRGPAPVSRLAAELDAALPELSNGLRQLREAGIVVVRRAKDARSSTRSPTTGSRRCSIGSSARGRHPERVRPVAHVLRPPRGAAGRVALPRAALARRAAARPDGTVSVRSPRALEGSASGAVEPGRRRLAFECLDATEHAAHLAGALGDALAQRCSPAGGSSGWAPGARCGSPRPAPVGSSASSASSLVRDLEAPCSGPARRPGLRLSFMPGAGRCR